MCLIKKNNRTKQIILDLTFDRHLTPYEMANIISNNGDLDRIVNNVRNAAKMYSSKYDPNKKAACKGYDTPYLRRRFIRSKDEQERRHGTYEYICTAKGRRMSCEYRKRDELGLPDIKTRNKAMYNSDVCDGKCQTCHYKP